MYNTSLRIVGCAAEAQDVMQDAFLDAFAKIDTYRGTSTFGAWLKRIVVNRSLDALRLKNRIQLVSPDDWEQAAGIAEEAAPDEEQMNYTLELIGQKIMELKDNYRIVLSLYLLEGYDHEEIALILNTTNGNVRARYSRARKKLLDLLKKANIHQWN